MTSATAKSSEPTIDDILASIRRIIADEQQAINDPGPPARQLTADDGGAVLDLAGPIGGAAAAPAHATPPQSNDFIVPLKTGKSGKEPALPPRPVAASKPLSQGQDASGSGIMPAQPAGPRLERLIAGEAEEALTAAFGRISALKVSAETRTLEGLVAELLRPMLKEWLDAHLPAIAERLVKQEIQRIADQASR